MSLTQLRPRSATEIADVAIQIVRRHYGPLFVLSALVAIPSLLVGAAQLWLMPGAMPASIEPGAWLQLIALTFVGLVFFFIGMGALVRSVSAAYVDGHALEPGAAIRLALGRGWRLVGANLWAYLRITGFSMLVIILFMVVGGLAMAVVSALGLLGGGSALGAGAPLMAGVLAVVVAFAMVLVMMFAFARYVTVTPVVMLEDAGALAAVRRARELSTGNLRRSAGLMLVVFVLYVLGYVSVWAIGTSLLRDEQLASVLAGVATVPLYPMVAAIITVLYYDLRIRREGLDIELLARELSEASEVPGAIVPAREGAR
ncbi:MAG TPA: hypothetical protein VHQ45_07410 [Gemmatimonadaceae bacterium]|nr:hypothetical protein [Gemmatimonadaceae bacterium]